MLTVLKLEAIGENMFGSKRAWAAEIIGITPRGGFTRRFLKAQTDYTRANSIGSRGVYKYYFLEEGRIYEISSPESRNRTDRYFATITDGEICKMPIEDVVRCMEKLDLDAMF